MTQYKLTYFNFRGRAEPIRILFAVAGVPFQDVRVSFIKFFIIKCKLPFGQLPILQFGETTISQTDTIGRYLARKFGFHGKDDFESAQIDEISDACKDYLDAYGKVRAAKNKSAKATALKTFTEEVSPKYLGTFSHLLDTNGGHFLVGNSLTWADIVVFNWIDFFGSVLKLDLTKDYPTLQTFVQEIEATPKIHEWIQKRPKTKM